MSTINELMKSQGSKSQAKKALDNKNSKIIEPHIKDIQNNIKALNDILSKFGTRQRVVLPNDPSIVERALQLKCKYQLGDSDSLHIATVLHGAQRDIASFDTRDFGKVDGLNIWCKYGVYFK